VAVLHQPRLLAHRRQGAGSVEQVEQQKHQHHADKGAAGNVIGREMHLQKGRRDGGQRRGQ
jgi:hypothetical protein